MIFKKLVVALAVAGFASSAYATNVMNLEGYGPIATGMGGASMAYDNGTAAVMNNPATLGLMPDGSRLDVAVGFLGPDVNWQGGGMTSGGDSYIMPALGYVRKSGPLAYGVGVFAQGGMGTEYPNANYGAGGMRSEVSVGRLILPLAYDVAPNLSIGGSVDFVWAGMDVNMYDPSTFNYISFSDDSDYTGKAKGTGWAGKLGLVYKITDKVNIGAVYQSKTSLSDLKGDGQLCGPTSAPPPPMSYGCTSGTYRVLDFQWPETYGIGIAVQATPDLMIAADIKHAMWSDVMKDFKLSFNGGAFPAMAQNWDDQTVYQIGLSYRVSEPFTLRAGYNYGKNPIPDATLNPLFPAIVESHWTAGFGYAFSPISDINFSLTYAPEVSQTGTSSGTVTHSQTNWQLMYSHRF